VFCDYKEENMTQGATRENINVLKDKFKQQLITYRYSKVTYDCYMRIFSWLESYLTEQGEADYSPRLGYLFIAEYRVQPKHHPSEFNRAKILISRLDDIVKNNEFSPRFINPSPCVPQQFKEWYEKYCGYLKQVGMSDSTIRGHSRYARRILVGLEKNVSSYETLTAADLYNFYVNNDNMPRQSHSVARRFFSFLYKNDVIKSDLSVCVPYVRLPKPLPSVYTSDEIDRILAAVDRSEPTGKRDYAILMLASHMGMRSSDIVNLSMKNIDTIRKSISIIQVKTSTPQTFVMNDDVKNALFDYINNGRPNTESDKIFLGSAAPCMPILAATCFSITRKYIVLAGIEPQGRRCGPHALRASYATALIRKGVPYSVVQEALGHKDLDSSKSYIRNDARRLKTCALDVPVPTGAFAAAIGFYLEAET